ncbi:hypothetical protein ANN_04448 [Periplaneta americana]|uniref:Mariner Mos1 transposase n=1 Tax=Periplaneta americana TaxID=6978 RepID=A0ABQ8T8L4_PERAM|nr:hypothetical protein ANN_04448 [Periplaneta americana]
MLTFSFDSRSPLLVEFLEHGTTFNGQRYEETLQKLRRTIKSKRHGMLSNDVILFHGNARPHTANFERNTIKRFGWETLQHPPPYSPDLSPCYFHIFGELKKDIRGLRFASDEDVCDWNFTRPLVLSFQNTIISGIRLYLIEESATSQLPHDWRRLVGSIRRRVRGKNPTTAAAAPSSDKMPAFMTSSDPAVRDDFLRATMRIFLVVSPPMGRLQVVHRKLFSDEIQHGQEMTSNFAWSAFSGIEFFTYCKYTKRYSQLFFPLGVSHANEFVVPQHPLPSSVSYLIRGRGNHICSENKELTCRIHEYFQKEYDDAMCIKPMISVTKCMKELLKRLELVEVTHFNRLFNDVISTTWLFSVDEICDSEQRYVYIQGIVINVLLAARNKPCKVLIDLLTYRKNYKSLPNSLVAFRVKCIDEAVSTLNEC